MRTAAALGLAFLLAQAGGTAAAQLHVLGGSALEPVLAELLPRFETRSGHKVSFDLNGAIGAMAERVQRGERADVLIVSAAQIDALEQQGKTVAGTKVDIAKTGVGLFVRKGAARPDIATVEAFKEAMRAAKSIGYNDPAAGAPVGIYLRTAFERLGLAAEVTPKTVVFKQRSERFAAVARGDVELGFNQISEIVAVPDVDLVGPLPPPIQNYTLFSAAVVAASSAQAAAREFIAFLASATVRPFWIERGFEAPE